MKWSTTLAELPLANTSENSTSGSDVFIASVNSSRNWTLSTTVLFAGGADNKTSHLRTVTAVLRVLLVNAFVPTRIIGRMLDMPYVRIRCSRYCNTFFIRLSRYIQYTHTCFQGTLHATRYVRVFVDMPNTLVQDGAFFLLSPTIFRCPSSHAHIVFDDRPLTRSKEKEAGRAGRRTENGAEGGMVGRGAERQCDSPTLQLSQKPSSSIPDEGER